MKKLAVCLIVICFSSALAVAETETNELSIIPRPMRMLVGEGGFTISAETVIQVTGTTRPIGEYLGRLLKQATGFEIKLAEYSAQIEPAGAISLRIAPETERLGPEGYVLKVNPESVVIKAWRPPGVFYACQTLMQMVNFDGDNRLKGTNTSWNVPVVEIEDMPRFRWRGLMMDCSRTFQSLQYLKDYIDILSYYKLNVFHLHLTDDQGWRLEIKQYPELITVGSKFADKYHKPGGYYTQDQMREIIRYAASRHVRIVPEIEMPGHCLAALVSYPHLSCTGEQFEIYPFFKGPSIQENVFCAGQESTFEFLENVLDEVSGLFPCEFIHIGGDEVPKTNWEKCPGCQQRIRQEGLRDEKELQSYFVKRIEKFLNMKNKRLIGWDEILEGGLAPRATVMSWRGKEGGIEAARGGHDVVMSPTSHCYLDYTYDDISVENAYSFQPLPEELSDDQRKRILGLQGNIWTHIATTEDAVDRQVFPRQIALAEVAWTMQKRRSWESFRARLEAHFARLAAMGIRYHEPAR